MQGSNASQRAAGKHEPRVLLVCDGLLKYASGLAGGLFDAGALPTLVTRDHALEFGGDRDEMHRDIARLAGPGVPLWTLSGRVLDRAGMRPAREISRARRAFRPDVVHLQDGTANDPRLLLIAGLRRGRYAYTVHDPVKHPGDSEAPRHARALRRLLLRGAGLIFVHAESLRDEFLRIEGLSVPVAVVPHGTSPPTIAPVPRTPSILLFGRLSAYKGIDVMLDAMGPIWDVAPQTRLVIAGDGEIPAHPALADERVDVRRGHVPESAIPDLFAEATFVALPYVQASQSGVGSLAKSHGRAMVVTSVGGLPELVADGSGTVVAPNDARALVDAALRLIDDPAQAQEMGRAGAQAAAASTSWRAVGEMTLGAYAEHGLLD